MITYCICQHCDRSYAAKSPRHMTKYCSAACRQAAYRRKHDPEVGSRARRQARAAAAASTMRHAIKPFKCEECGCEYRIPKNQALRMYCGDACKQRAYRKRQAALRAISVTSK